MADLTALTLTCGMLRDAVSMVQSGFASAADVDTAMRLGAGHPAGPLDVLRTLTPGELATVGVTDIPGTGEAPAAAATGTPWPGPVAVLGTGTMATGIAETVAAAGTEVRVLARSTPSADRLTAAVDGNLARTVRRGRRTAEDAAAVRARITTTTDPAALTGTGLVIEAVAERLDVKQSVLSGLDSALPKEIPFATNTSSFRVAELAHAVDGERPVLALHFFNPAPAMKLVEVIGPPALADTGVDWARTIGKTPIRCGDARGFLVNRLLIPYLNDAARLLDDTAATAEHLDTVMTEAGHPMGPLALVDLIGVDVTVAALAAMAGAFDDPRLVPAPALHRLQDAGRLGRKSGQGFHTYPRMD